MTVTVGDAVFWLRSDNSQLNSGLAAGERQVQGFASRIGGFMSNALSFATGQLIVQGVGSIANGIKGLAGEALGAVASNEMLELSLKNLAAREIKNSSGVEKTLVTGQRRVGLTETEQKESEKLADSLESEQDKRQRLLETIALEERALQKLQSAKKVDDLAVDRKKNQIQNYRDDVAKLDEKMAEQSARYDELQSKGDKLVDVTTKVVEGQMSMKEAMEQAGPRAKELADWMQELAIKSPFTREGVANAFKGVMVYGFGTKEAQRMTKAMMDWSAGAGQGEAAMGRVALALGQIKAKGKLAGQEVLQLVNAGVDVRAILGKAFNVTGEELQDMQEKGLLPADKVIEAIISSMEQDFPDAASKATSTWDGLMSSMSDIKEWSLRNLFGGIFQKAQPYVAAVVDKLADPTFQDSVAKFGKFLGDQMVIGIDKLSDFRDFLKMQLVPAVQGLWDIIIKGRDPMGDWTTWFDYIGVGSDGVLGTIADIVSKFGAFAAECRTAVSEDGLRGLGTFLADQFSNNVWPIVWAEIQTWPGKFWEWFVPVASEAAGKLDELSKQFSDWVEGPGQEVLSGIGRNIGVWIGAGIKQLFSDQGESDGIAQSIFGHIWDAAIRNMSSFQSIGAIVATGLITGLWEGLTGKKVEDDTANKIKEFLKTVAKLANPIALGTEFFKEWWGGFTKSLKNVGNFLQGKDVSWEDIWSAVPHFANGGIVPGRLGEPTLAVLHGGEEVKPVNQTNHYWQPTFQYGNAPSNPALDVQLTRFAAGV